MSVPLHTVTIHELIDSRGNPVYTDGEGRRIVISELWGRPLSPPPEALLEAVGWKRATLTVTIWADGTREESDNIGEYKPAEENS